MAKPRELPDTLSGLLRVAVEDSIAIEDTPGYGLNMANWYKTNGVCEVCMGGAVMIRSAGFVPAGNLFSYDELRSGVEFTLRRKMLVINDMRGGSMETAFERLDLRSSSRAEEALLKAEDKVKYNWDSDLGRANWKAYLEAADILEKAGL